MAALKYWVWLAEKSKISQNKAIRLLGHFGSPDKLFFAREDELKAVKNMRKDEISALMDKRLNRAVEIVEFCSKNKVRIITINDAEYPDRLRNIYNPPIVLYVLGRWPEVDEEASVAIVGTRKCSEYGALSAEKIAKEYARSGGLVVTGMAVGIDSAAARGALKGGGRVIAVLGSGINVLYPYENRKLFKEVYKHGAIISEFSPDTPPYRTNFPKRNRIISGLSLGVLVVEAPEKSGSLITAARASEQGRDVFAVPGDINKQSFAGSNELLHDGAMMIRSGYELAGEYMALYPNKIQIWKIENENIVDEKDIQNFEQNDVTVYKKLNESTKIAIDNTKSVEYIDLSKMPDLLTDDEKAVVAVMNSENMQVDEIIEKSGLSVANVLSALTMLEIEGYVRQYAGKNFSLAVAFKF